MNNIQEFYTALKNYTTTWETLNGLLKNKISPVVRSMISNTMTQVLVDRDEYIPTLVEWNAPEFFTTYKDQYIMLLDYNKHYVLFGVDVGENRISCKVTERTVTIIGE